MTNMPLSSIATCLLFASHASAPPPAMRISSGFGVRADPIRAGTGVHHGIDVPGRLGSPVLAAAPGVVGFAGRRGGYGNLIELDHADGSRTRYGHLAALHVRAGDRVGSGDTIASMGSTGRSTGSHLHFELLVGGHAVDPLPCFGTPLPKRGASPMRLAPLPAAAPYRSAFSRARQNVGLDAKELPTGTQTAERAR